MPDFKRKKTPSKDESRKNKMEPVAAKVPKMTPKSRVEPKRRLPDFEKIEKELIKKNKPRVDEWGPMEVIKKRDFEWPALPSDCKIIWNNPFYQPYSLGSAICLQKNQAVEQIFYSRPLNLDRFL
jgi:hypothetical protein